MANNYVTHIPSIIKYRVHEENRIHEKMSKLIVLLFVWWCVLGICDADCIMLVLELAPKGPLNSFLKNNK